MILRQSPSGPIVTGSAPGEVLTWDGAQWLPSNSSSATPWQFFPAVGVDLPFQTVNADAALNDGVFQGVFRTVGKGAELLFFFAVGPTTVLGTGPLFLPSPPGIVPDVTSNPAFVSLGGAIWPAAAAGQIGGSFFGPATLTAGVFGILLNDFNEIPGLAAGDLLLVSTQIQIL